MKEQEISDCDLYELLAHVAGATVGDIIEDFDESKQTIEWWLNSKYGLKVDAEAVKDLVRDIFNELKLNITPVTQEVFVGAYVKEGHLMRALCKKFIPDADVVEVLLRWLYDFEKDKPRVVIDVGNKSYQLMEVKANEKTE